MAASDQANRTDPPRLPLLTRLIATGLFTGYSPWASGTIGTLTGVLIYAIPGVEQPPVLLGLIVIGFFAGVVTSRRVAAAYGGTLTSTAARAKELFQPHSGHGADPSIVVIDEIVGMWISLLWVPKSLATVLFCFLIFRILDIIKPQPARLLERLPGGWGIMLDDVIAGAYTNGIFHLVWFIGGMLFPEFISHIM